jgi:divalent metal cation (Fe/Co/Zn/Cd) transporter
VLELTSGGSEGTYWPVYATLAFAFVAEGISLLRAVRQTRSEARERRVPWRAFVRETTRRIRAVLESDPSVDEVLDLRTMYVGPRSLLVAARIDLAAGGLDAEAIEQLSTSLDDRLQRAVPDVQEVFLDPTPRPGER